MTHKQIVRNLVMMFAIFTMVIGAVSAAAPTDFPSDLLLQKEKVEYQLPYFGILPDHPLFLLKVVRDRIQEFTTFDESQRIELYLLFSDKRIAMADALAKNGKNKLAITTLSKGEKYMVRIQDIIVSMQAKKRKPEENLILNLKLSNVKHAEVIKTLIKELPQGDEGELSEVLRLNNDIHEFLETL